MDTWTDKKLDAGALMAFWSNIAPENQVAYLRWHNAEHIPERVSMPGFLFGRRYRQVRDVDRFLMCYDTVDPAALVSETYLRALNSPTRWTREALTWFQKPMRNVYRVVEAIGAPGPAADLARPAAPVLAVVRHGSQASDDRASGEGASNDPAAGPESAAARAAFSDIGELPAFRRVVRYTLDQQGSGVRTREAGIHGAASGTAGGMLWVESTDLSLLGEHLDGRDHPDSPDTTAQLALTQAIGTWAAAAGLRDLEPVEFYSIDFSYPGLS